MVVSEEYQYIIIAVEDKLHVYKFDRHVLKFGQSQGGQVKILGEPLILDLQNDGEGINNLKLIRCDNREFICTVDFGANVRMLFLDNLQRECIKFKNVYAGKEDNSTWSLCGSMVNPPRVVVGSNAYKVTVFDL